MSDLPPHKGDLTPRLQEPDSFTSDLSNPYAYPNERVEQVNKEDPQLQKLKSSFWKRAGQLQSTIGSLAQLESWQNSGQQIENEADRTYREAEERLREGEASRIHGEYESWMGWMSYAVGHIAGDPEMQARGSQRSRQGEEEIERTIK